MSRQMIRWSTFVVAATFVVLGAPAYADHNGPPHGQFSGSPDQGSNSSATIGGTQTTTHTTPGTSSSTGSSGSTGSSSPISSSTGSTADVPLGTLTGGGACDPATYGPGGYAPGWPVPAPCKQPTPGTPAKPGKPAAPPQVTTQMVTDAAQVVAPTSTPHVEPGTRSYVNIPNNYWTEAPTVRTSVTVLGQAIALTWTPTGTTWDFGDGSTATGTGIEGAALGQAGSIEHAYLRQGSYDITTSTTYDLSFVLPGQGTQTIPLTSPPSAPVTLPVSEIQTRVSYAR